MKLFLASNNQHKVREMGEILAAACAGEPIQILTPADYPQFPEPEETGATFEENALIKARFWTEATGLLALADDSGLVVDALDGRPGVASARYAPSNEERIARVLDEMKGMERARRTARFVCVAVLADPVGGCALRRGEVEGLLTEICRGEGGFGYDPIFELIEPPYACKTTAELTSEQKNSLSHRGRALRAIIPVILSSLKSGRVLDAVD